MHRTVRGLIWAQPVPRPPSIPISRGRGVKALGRAYEKKVAKAFPDAQHGQWFEFLDVNGHGFCQPDLIFIGDPIWVLEVKLTDVESARSQLEDLYFPVLKHVYKRAVRGVVVVKHVSKVSLGAKIVENFDQAIAQPGIPVIHWRGNGPLSPSLSPVKPREGLFLGKNLSPLPRAPNSQ